MDDLSRLLLSRAVEQASARPEPEPEAAPEMSWGDVGRNIVKAFTQNKNQDKLLRSIGAAASSAADPLGLPSYALSKVAPEAAEAWRAHQASEGLAPHLAGGVLAPVGTLAGLLKAGVQAAPKVATGMAAAYGLTGESDALNAQQAGKGKPQSKAVATQEALSDPLRDTVKGHPSLEALYEAYRAKDAEARAATDPKMSGPSSQMVRARAAEDAAALRKQLLEKIDEMNPLKKSFGQEHPWLNKNLPLMQMAAGGLGGAIYKTGAGIAERIANAPWSRAVRVAEREAGKAIPDPVKFNTALTRAEKYAEAAREPLSKAGRGAEIFNPGASLAGGIFGAEAALLPHQYNLRNAPPDSEDYKTAMARTGTVPDWLLTVGQGAALGALGAQGGAHFAGAMPGVKMRLPFERTDALSTMRGQNYARDLRQVAENMGADAAARARVIRAQGDIDRAGAERLTLADELRRPKALPSPVKTEPSLPWPDQAPPPAQSPAQSLGSSRTPSGAAPESPPAAQPGLGVATSSLPGGKTQSQQGRQTAADGESSASAAPVAKTQPDTTTTSVGQNKGGSDGGDAARAARYTQAHSEVARELFRRVLGSGQSKSGLPQKISDDMMSKLVGQLNSEFKARGLSEVPEKALRERFANSVDILRDLNANGADISKSSVNRLAFGRSDPKTLGVAGAVASGVSASSGRPSRDDTSPTGYRHEDGKFAPSKPTPRRSGLNGAIDEALDRAGR